MATDMTQIGDARVSRADQDPQLQIDALKRAGCAKIFVDHMTGSHMNRPQLSPGLSSSMDFTLQALPPPPLL
jgi:DNA invertase Pin-like site-specific DNA recombinase